MSFLPAVVILALATFTGLTVYVVRAVVSYRIDPPVPAEDSDETETRLLWLEGVVRGMDARLDNLILAVDDGIKRVDRAENRIQKTVTSARRLVREAGLEHAGIEAEFEELQSADAEGIEPLPAMPEQVEEGRAVRIAGGHLEIGAA